MYPNPYEYKGPLDPIKNSLVCVPRSDDVSRVIEGIIGGSYWVIPGPKGIGKTTFLRQIQSEFPNAYYIYFDFGVPRADERDFYRELIKTVLNTIPSEQNGQPDALFEDWADSDPGFGFFIFLQKFKAKNENRKIIFLVDEIDRLPSLLTFLRIWRKVYHERDNKKKLNRYCLIVTGSADLIELTDGPTSPFNIAEILELKDFTYDQSERLIADPMKHLGIGIDPEAKKHLISRVSGHPQMLQQICRILVDMALESKKGTAKEDIDNAVEILFKESLTLETLTHDLQTDNALANLVTEILNGKKKKFFPYREFAISGAGAIVENNNSCAIRNKIFERFLQQSLLNR